MKGTGRASGAITIVNALPTGIGSAAAISLFAEASVELARNSGAPNDLAIPAESDTPIVRACLAEGLRRFAPVGISLTEVRITSSIPPARGLKSSSAVGVAIARAMADAVGRSIQPAEAARFSSEVSRDSGLSATGAFDDAFASAMGGFVVSDNSDGRLLRHDAADTGWKAVLWIPRAEHRPSPHWLDAFQVHAAEGRRAALAARTGRYLAALERNTELVERILGLEYGPLRRTVRRAGAIAAGVSGMGPTLAAIVPTHRVSSVAQALPRENADVLDVDLLPPREPAQRASPP